MEICKVRKKNKTGTRNGQSAATRNLKPSNILISEDEIFKLGLN
jgi:hypothetical protein